MRVCLLIICLTLIKWLGAQDGTLDNTFSTAGITKASLNSSNGVYANVQGDLTRITVQKDEKIIQVGYKSSSTGDDFIIIRYLKDGGVDMGFGLEGGWTATNISGNDRAHSAAMQSDDKIVVGGETVVSGKNIGALVRYQSNGTLDPGFGTGGIVRCDLFPGASGINSVAVQPDGKIIVAGFAFNGSDNDFFLARYLADGTLDATFGGGGKTATHLQGGDIATDVKIHSDGRILLAGTANTGSTNKFALALYTPAGVLDPAFAGSGKLITTMTGEGRTASIGATGLIYFTGLTLNQFTTLGYNLDGTVNTSFGGSGIVQTTGLGNNALSRSVIVQCDGKVVVGGEANRSYVVVRYLPDGSPDPAFNGSGRFNVNTGNNNRDYGFSGLAIQEGKILMGGISFTPLFYNSFFPTVTRLKNPSTVPFLQITNPLPTCTPSVDLKVPGVTQGSEANLAYSYWEDKLATLPLSNPEAITTAGTYYIKGTNPGGCFSIKPVIVSFSGSQPPGNITPAAASICPGSAQLLSATPGTSYQWKRDGVDIVGATTSTYSATTAGSYSVIIGSGGCSVLSNSASVSVKPAPTGSISPASASICSGSSQLLTATGGTTYQWTLNGNSISGATTSTYNATSSGTYGVTIVDGACEGAAANTTTIDINNAVTPSVSISASPSTTILPGTGVTFTAVATHGGPGAQFQWKINGVNAGSGSTTFTTNALVNGDVVTTVLSSSLTCVTSATATSNQITISVPAITPSVNIAAAPSTTICNGTSVTFTATAVNGGAAPAYEWKKNGVTVASNGGSFTSSGLVNGDMITVEMTSNAPGASPAAVSSNSLTMSVTTSIVPAVSISANPGTTICNGTPVTFTATTIHEGASPVFQWKRNGLVIGTNSPTFTTSTISNGDVFSVELFSNAPCAAPASVSSNDLTFTMKAQPTGSVSPASASICPGGSQVLTASGGTSYQWIKDGVGIPGAVMADYVATQPGTYAVHIINGTCSGFASNSVVITVSSAPVGSVSPATATICTGGSQVLTATGGTSYQWLLNGVVIPGATMATYTAANPGTYSVNIVNGSCVGPATNEVIISPAAALSGNITPATASICAGSSQLLTASGGTVYQWMIDGVAIPGATSPTLSATTAGTYSVIVSNGSCSGMASNTALITTTPALSGNIAPVSGSICQGSSLVLTASGGLYYQWQKDGLNIAGASSHTFAASEPGIYSVLVSNGSCTVTANNTSTITVSTALTPTASIIASPSGAAAPGTSVTFTATITNGGTAPTYKWLKNGTEVGSNSPAYTDVGLQNGDNVSLLLTSSATCATPATVTANNIIVSVAAGTVSPSVQITADDGNAVCAGTNVRFRATSVHGGSAPTYQWKKNGNPVGTDASIFSTSSLVHGDVITVEMTSVAPNGVPVSVTSNGITMTVTTVSGTLSPGSATICPGGSGMLTVTGGTSYQWYQDGTPITGSTGATYTATIPGRYSVQITKEGCSAASNEAVVSLSGSISASIAPASATICAGSSQLLSTSGGTSYQWRKGGVDIPGATNPAYMATEGGNYTVMIKNGSCSAPALNESIITVSTTPAGSISPANASICSGGMQILTAGGGSSYQWYRNGTIINGATEPTYAASMEGSYKVIVFNGTCSGPALNESVISITSKPVGSITPASSSICTGSVQLLTTSGGTTYQWMLNGNAIIGATGADFAADKEGTYSVVIYNGTCSSPGSNTSTISFKHLPSGSISPASATICPGGTQKLTASGGATYQWLYNGVPIRGANTEVFMASQAGDYKVITYLSGCSDTAFNASTITINEPTGTITPASAIICPGSAQLLTATGGDSYQWMKDGVSLPGASNSSYAAAQTGEYKVQIFKNGCAGYSANNSVVSAAPVPAGTISPVGDSICRDEIKTLFASGGSSYQWYFNGASISGATASTYGAAKAGVYNVIISNATCSAAASNTAVITNRYQPAGLRYTTVNVAKSQPYPVEAKRTGTSYLWSPSVGLNATSLRSPIVTTLSDRLYTVSIEQPSGCPLVDTVQVRVFDKPEVYVPNAFTPNGDGRNDLLRPTAVQVVQISYFRIFNRWGELIYQTNSFDGGWDGTHKGKLQPGDTYVWIFEGKDTNGKVVSAKGTTTLFR